MCPMVTAFPVPLLPSKASCRTSCMCNAIIASMYCNMLRAASLDTRVARHIIETVLCCLFCAAAIGASTEVISANLYVTDSPVSSAYGKNVTAGDRLVANFALRDIKTNATIGASLGYCVLLRDAGPNQCLYTIQFASGTIQVGHTGGKAAVDSMLLAIMQRHVSNCNRKSMIIWQNSRL